MAEVAVAKSINASPDATTGMLCPQVSHKILAVDVLSPMTPLTMRSDGLLYIANGAAANGDAIIFGWSTRAGKAGQTMTVYGVGLVGKYSNSLLTPGQILYLGTAAGGAGVLSSGTSVGDTVGCAQAIDADNIRIIRNN